MPYKHPEIQSNSPYYDDFEDTKNFLKILFKPGYSVQARELTQIQTILQSQLSKLADHIFLDGSQVVGGKVNISPVTYVRVEKFTSDDEGVLGSSTVDAYMQGITKTQTSYDDSTLQTNQLLGTIQKTQLEIYKYDSDTDSYATTSSGTVLLLHYSPSGYSGTDDYTVLFFMPITGSDDLIGTNDLLKVKNDTVYFKIINPSLDTGTGIYSVPPFGAANLISVDDGIFYLDGLFVKNYSQLIAPYYDSTNSTNTNIAYSEDGNLYDFAESGVRLFTYPSVRVGLAANKTVVTALTDPTLRDPANGFYNSNAPGADRYTINLVLSQLPFDPQSVDIENYSNSDFIQLVRLVDGRADWIRRLTNYSEILEIFARRTYDESGSYTVIPFQVEVKNHYREDYYEVLIKNVGTDFGIGTYVFGQDVVNDNTNPFASGFDFDQYGVLQVLSVTPYKELTNTEGPGINSVLVRLGIRSPNKLAFDVNSSTQGGYGTLYYRSSANSPTQSILLKLRSYNIDVNGAYSPQDLPVGDLTKMALAVQPGKAYVYGYEYENYFQKYVDYLKKDAESQAEQTLTASSYSMLGNYVVGYFAADTTEADIQWEKLPKFKLNSDDLMVLIMEEGEDISVSAPIYSWSPSKLWQNTKYIKGTSRKYESVIFIQDEV